VGKNAYSRTELSEMFRRGMERKTEEVHRFSLLSVEFPEKSELYTTLSEYASVDLRYYELASLYYSGDVDKLDDGTNEDLLLITRASELPPRLYAEYLRQIPAECREEEKVTHKALQDLKASIRRTVGTETVNGRS